MAITFSTSTTLSNAATFLAPSPYITFPTIEQPALPSKLKIIKIDKELNTKQYYSFPHPTFAFNDYTLNEVSETIYEPLVRAHIDIREEFEFNNFLAEPVHTVSRYFGENGHFSEKIRHTVSDWVNSYVEIFNQDSYAPTGATTGGIHTLDGETSFISSATSSASFYSENFRYLNITPDDVHTSVVVNDPGHIQVECYVDLPEKVAQKILDLHYIQSKDYIDQQIRQEIKSKIKDNLVIKINRRQARKVLPIHKINLNEIKARESLRDMITESEWRGYLTNGFIMVKGGSGLWYQIFNNQHEQLRVYKNGKFIQKICIHTDYECPPTDHVINMKVLVEIDEESVAAGGNVYTITESEQKERLSNTQMRARMQRHIDRHVANGVITLTPEQQSYREQALRKAGVENIVNQPKNLVAIYKELKTA